MTQDQANTLKEMIFEMFRSQGVFTRADPNEMTRRANEVLGFIDSTVEPSRIGGQELHDFVAMMSAAREMAAPWLEESRADRFAGLALEGLVTVAFRTPEDFGDLAKKAWAISDAMMQEKKRREENTR